MASIDCHRGLVSQVNWYLDESGADGGSASSIGVVGGLLLDQCGLDGFNSAWSEMLSRFHIKSIHMREIRGRGGISMQAGKMGALLEDATRLINGAKIYSVGAAINVDLYRTHISPSIDEKMGWYGFAFLMIADKSRKITFDHNYLGDLGFVFDPGNSKMGHVKAAFEVMSKMRESMSLNLGSLRFEVDDSYAPIQAADLIAWTVRRLADMGPESFKNGFEPLLDLLDGCHVPMALDETAFPGFAAQLNETFCG